MPIIGHLRYLKLLKPDLHGRTSEVSVDPCAYGEACGVKQITGINNFGDQ